MEPDVLPWWVINAVWPNQQTLHSGGGCIPNGGTAPVNWFTQINASLLWKPTSIWKMENTTKFNAMPPTVSKPDWSTFHFATKRSSALGAVHKVRHAQGSKGVQECVTVCDGGRLGFKSMWRHAYNFFYLTYETWNLKWCLTFCCNRSMYSDRRGNGQKLPDKRPPDKTPRTKTAANNWENLYRGLLSGFLY